MTIAVNIPHRNPSLILHHQVGEFVVSTRRMSPEDLVTDRTLLVMNQLFPGEAFDGLLPWQIELLQNPQPFESMVFAGNEAEGTIDFNGVEGHRWETEEEARLGHAALVARYEGEQS